MKKNEIKVGGRGLISTKCKTCGAVFTMSSWFFRNGRKYCSFICYNKSGTRRPPTRTPVDFSTIPDLPPRTFLVPNIKGFSVDRKGNVWTCRPINGTGKCMAWRRVRPFLVNGYLKINVDSKPIRLHKIVLDTFIGPCPPGMECRHLNGNPLDNRLSNLAWGTKSENSQDSIRHKTHSGLGRSGERHPMWGRRFTKKLKES